MNFKKTVASLLLLTSLTVPMSQGCLAVEAGGVVEAVEAGGVVEAGEAGVVVEAGEAAENYSHEGAQAKDKSHSKKSFIKKAGQVVKIAAGVGVTSYLIFSGRKQIGHIIKGVKDLSGDAVKLVNYASKNLTVPGRVATLGATSVGSYVIGRRAVRSISLVVGGLNKAKKELIDNPFKVVKNDAAKVVNAVIAVKDKVTGNKKQKTSKKKNEPGQLQEISIKKAGEVNVKFTSESDNVKGK